VLATVAVPLAACSGGYDTTPDPLAPLADAARADADSAGSIAEADRSAAELAAEVGDVRRAHAKALTHEVEREEYARNSADRCYWCKDELFETLSPIASERGACIAVGTNADDLGDFRPGQRAARERGIVAPLAEVGLTKKDVRDLSADIGLPTADKPASPCLSSRFAYGVRVTPEGLRRVEEAEEIVRSLGFEVFRVRDHGDLARIEVPEQEIERAAALGDDLDPSAAQVPAAVLEARP
jgi:uncharacterized protein